MKRHINKSHVSFLLLSMVISSNFFRLSIVPGIITKSIGFAFALGLVLWSFMKILQNGRMARWIKEVRFFFLFLLVIFASTIPSLVYWHQPILKSLYVIYPWAYFLVFVVMAVRGYNQDEVYEALKKYTILFGVVMAIALFMPYRIIGGELGGELDISRGVSRVRMGGTYYMHLFGFLNMVLYCQKGNKKYLHYYLLCLLMVVLSVSRQHIVVFSFMTLGYMLVNMKMRKSILMIIVGALMGLLILPYTSIYKGLVQTEHDENIVYEGEEDNVRILSAKYFVNEFPSNNVTRMIGNCQYNMDSPYGKHIEDLRVFFLSDIGFVGIYVYYGVVGLFLLFCMLYYTMRTNVAKDFMGCKLYIYYLFLTNILSHSFDIAQVGIAMCLYLIAYQSLKNKQLQQCRI